jgi:exopolysaccharide production protein ExoQ
MMPRIASCIFALGMLGLCILDRERKFKASWALWLPVFWLFISGSRHVSEWQGGLATAMTANQYLQGSPVDAAVYAVLILASIVVLAGRGRMVGKVLRENPTIVLFVVYCAVSVVWSDFPGVALKRWIKSLGDYAMILIMLTEFNSEAALRQVLARVSFVVIPTSILFIKYYPALGRTYATHWTGTQFFVGVCDTKNMLGMVCLVFGLSALCRILEAWRGPRRERNKYLIVHGTIVVMAAWLLKLSDSKTSLACFFLTGCLLVAHAFLPVARKRLVLHIMVAGVVLTCFTVLFLGIGGGALKAMGRNPTLTGRTDIWAVLLSVPINPVLGTGFESFWLGARLIRVWSYQIVNGLTEAHNGYLEIYLNLGWVGISLLAAMLWTGYRNILRLIRKDPQAGRLRLGFFLIAVIYNFTEAGFRSTDLIWLAFLIAITALPARPRLKRPEGKTRSIASPLDQEPALQAL